MNKIILKGTIILSSLYGIILSLSKVINWTYFTFLSNLFVLIVMCIFIYKDIKEYKGKIIKYSDTLYLIKFMSVISIMLTGLVFFFFLAPFTEDGFIGAYKMDNMSSLCLHFITPLLSVIDFILFDKDYKPKKIHVLYSLIPPYVYLIYIYILYNVFGINWGGMSAPYNFINYIAPTGWFGFDLSIRGWETLGIGVFYMIIILSLIFIGLGSLLIKLKKNK